RIRSDRQCHHGIHHRAGTVRLLTQSYMNLNIDIKPAHTIGQMRLRDGKLAKYQPYFHRLSNGNFQLRVVTENSNVDWIATEAKKGNIYIPQEHLTAEKS